jgi:hypothetical protein
MSGNKDKREILTRSVLRDVVIMLSLGSVCLFRASPPAVIVALALLETGCFIHFVSKGVLIRNEVLCRDGIYSIVRHPYYLANYLVDTSFCVLSGNPYLVLAYPFLFFFSYGPTFRQEETTLRERHEADAVAHILGTPGVFPDRHSIFRLGRLFQGFSRTRVSGKEIGRIVRFHSMWLLILAIQVVRWSGLKVIDLHSIPPVPSGLALPLWLALGALLLYGASTVIISRAARSRRAARVRGAAE